MSYTLCCFRIVLLAHFNLDVESLPELGVCILHLTAILSSRLEVRLCTMGSTSTYLICKSMPSFVLHPWAMAKLAKFVAILKMRMGGWP